MIAVAAAELHPLFEPDPADTTPGEARLVLFNDPSIGITGSVAEIRRLLTDSLHLLPIDGTEHP